MEQEAIIRMGFFAATFAGMAGWELRRPVRALRQPRSRRWLRNLTLTFGNTLLLRLALPVSAVASASWAETQGVGIFLTLGIASSWLGLILALGLLEFSIYLQHVVFHVVPPLWRLHMVHHMDQDFDVTTGGRFHPVEIALSAVIKIAIITALGISPVAVVIFEVWLSSAAIFSHANIALPSQLDQLVRRVIVTPDMHRVHHSTVFGECNSNFGFNLSLWDRCFGTYCDPPPGFNDQASMGLEEEPDPDELWPLTLATKPFTYKPKPASFPVQHKRLCGLAGLVSLGIVGTLLVYGVF